MKSRKGSTPTTMFLLSLGLALFVLIIGISIWARLERTDHSYQSYLELVDKIEEVNNRPDDSSAHHLLELKKGGGVVFFEPGEEMFSAQYLFDKNVFQKAFNKLSGLADGTYLIRRPEQCPEPEQACICHVNKFEIEPDKIDIFKGLLSEIMYSDKVRCDALPGKYYLSYRGCWYEEGVVENCWSGYQPIIREEEGKLDWVGWSRRFNQGLIVWREPEGFSAIGQSSMSELKHRPIFVEKYREYTALGIYDPVFTVSDKKIVDYWYLHEILNSCFEGYCPDAMPEMKRVLADEDGLYTLLFEALDEDGQRTVVMRFETREYNGEELLEYMKVKEEIYLETDKIYLVEYDGLSVPDLANKKEKDEVKITYTSGRAWVDGKPLIAIGNGYALQPDFAGPLNPNDLSLHIYYEKT